MKRANLPREKASEPDESAHQPLLQTKMPPQGENHPKKLTFAKHVDITEKTSSQKSSSYKEVLSQPPTELTHSQKLIWLQKRRTTGLWAQCDDCDHWRYLPNVLDRHELPKKWYCWMNSDTEFASCSAPESPLRIHDEEDLIHSEYSAGSLVWARMAGWPWWPAMVDDCPDAEQYYWLDGFSDIPTHYNVVFFDNMEVTRAWVAPDQLKPYTLNKNTLKHLKNKKFSNRLRAAMTQADEAEKLTLNNRLAKYSFIARHKGNIVSPKKVNKHDLKKYQRRFKKKFNIDFPIESSESEDDGVVNSEKKLKKNNNVIILGTPKKARNVKSRTSKEHCGVERDDTTAKHNACLLNNYEPQYSNNNESIVNTDKPPNSMVVQIGSTEADSIDNDTSTTYLPENSTQPLEFSVRMDTPNSDDFDF